MFFLFKKKKNSSSVGSCLSYKNFSKKREKIIIKEICFCGIEKCVKKKNKIEIINKKLDIHCVRMKK